MVTPTRLYPLHCTLYSCTLKLTLTRRQSSAPVALSSAFVGVFFCFKFCSVHSIGYNFHSTFSLAISFRNQQFLSKFSFLLEVSRELPQRSTLNTFFRCSQFSRCSLHSFNPVCSCIFLCVPQFCQFTQSFAPQWIPFFVPRGPNSQQAFGFCQLSLIRKTCLVTI